MSYHREMPEQAFFVAREQVPALLEALSVVTKTDDDYSLAFREEDAETFWAERDPAGNIVALHRSGSVESGWGFAKVIAPFVRDGSFLQYVDDGADEDRAIYRIVFQGGQRYVQYPRLVWDTSLKEQG